MKYEKLPDDTEADPRSPTHDGQHHSSSSTAPLTQVTLREDPVSKPTKEQVAWRDLPEKRQLAILTLARLSEPLVHSSIQAYMFYQLRWFDPSLPDSTISAQAGVLHASFTAAQFLTAMLWGRIADSPKFGRKTVLVIGLCGTSISCLGFGFATSFWQALACRVLGGVTNGNVGVMRTMYVPSSSCTFVYTIRKWLTLL